MKPTIEEMVQGIHDVCIFAGLHGLVGEPDPRILAAVETLKAVAEWKRELEELPFDDLLTSIEQKILNFGEEGS